MILSRLVCARGLTDNPWAELTRPGAHQTELGRAFVDTSRPYLVRVVFAALVRTS